MNIFAEVAQEAMTWPEAFASVGILAVTLGALVLIVWVASRR